MKFFLMSSFSFLKNLSMAMFDIPAIYRSLFVAEFSKCLAVSDFTALLILPFFIQLVAALYSPGKCWIACWPRAFTGGFFITFLTKSNSPQPLCWPLLLLLRGSSFSIPSSDCNICRKLISRNMFISCNKGSSVRQRHPFGWV